MRRLAALRPGFDDGAVFPALEQGRAIIHGDASLLLVPGVTFRAVLLQDRDDLMGEVDSGRPGDGGDQDQGENMENSHQKRHGSDLDDFVRIGAGV